MSPKEKEILKEAVNHVDGLLSPATLINGIAKQDRRSVENLVSGGYLEEVAQDVNHLRGNTYSLNFYRTTEKGRIVFESFYKRWWFNFRTQTALWVGVFTIIIGTASIFFTGISYLNSTKEDAILNRPYVFIDDSTIERLAEADDRYKIILEIKNEGNSIALNSKIKIFDGDTEVISSEKFQGRTIYSPHESVELWIIRAADRIALLNRESGPVNQLTIQIYYEDAEKRPYCIESKHSITAFDTTYKLATDDMNDCNN